MILALTVVSAHVPTLTKQADAIRCVALCRPVCRESEKRRCRTVRHARFTMVRSDMKSVRDAPWITQVSLHSRLPSACGRKFCPLTLGKNCYPHTSSNSNRSALQERNCSCGTLTSRRPSTPHCNVTRPEEPKDIYGNRQKPTNPDNNSAVTALIRR